VSEDEQQAKVDHEPPRGASTKATWNGNDYTATAKWLVLRKQDKPTAEVFLISYVADAAEPGRPVTFVFNGGPGAASAYLHMGAVGPQRVDFPAEGTMPTLPPKLVQNDESWLAFTDIVFIDPVGTGFSRLIEPDEAKDGEKTNREKKNGEKKNVKGDEHNPNEYFTVRRDLEAVCEAIARWLSANRRWGSPIFIAGESYGGYRTGRLVRMLQEETGVGLNGAILISPALEPAHLAWVFGWGDYEVEPWIDLLPTMAATAVHHGRSRAFERGTPVEDFLPEVEAFATGDYVSFLTRGAAMPAEERERVLTRFADITGLDAGLVTRAEGRVRVDRFVHELLRDEGKVVGRYDATITATDPFPDREPFGGADPTLTGFGAAFTTAVNNQLRQVIGVETDREYKLLSLDVIMAWKNDEAQHYIQATQGAVDDFRYGLAMNPHMKAFITHGWYDLMTPYYASDRFRNLMRLDPSVAGRVTVRHFGGGHMFYTWTESRKAFSAAIKQFVADAMANA
jgi:carboxypeptidase C (cathepsin A)